MLLVLTSEIFIPVVKTRKALEIKCRHIIQVDFLANL